MTDSMKEFFHLSRHLFKAHPWHGLSIGKMAPERVNCYIELTPGDSLKYEVDKETGHLKVDRPQKYSSQCPTLYGFIPRTFCGQRVGKYFADKTGQEGLAGDGDPLDICVIAEQNLVYADVVLSAVPIGGIRIIDREQVDDKIIAVLYQDSVFGAWKDIAQCPERLIDRLRHYFLTYKDIPGEETRQISFAEPYGAEEAKAVIAASEEDYREKFEKECRILARFLDK